MTEAELRKMASAVKEQFHDPNVTDERIIFSIKENPNLAHAILPSGSNLFLSAVLFDRFSVAQALADMGADIHWKNSASLIRGNALNVAHTPEQAEYLLGLGLEIEKNVLLFQAVYLNPAIMAAFHNDTTMLFYWLKKQKEIFAKAYLEEMIHVVMEVVSMMNQYNMLSCVIADDVLYGVLKEIYSMQEDEKSIKLILSAFKQIKDESLDARKKELRKILNTRKKEITNGKKIATPPR